MFEGPSQTVQEMIKREKSQVRKREKRGKRTRRVGEAGEGQESQGLALWADGDKSGGLGQEMLKKGQEKRGREERRGGDSQNGGAKGCEIGKKARRHMLRNSRGLWVIL